MAFDATIFPILIAGPSDVEKEMEMATLAVFSWNDGHARAMGLMMEPRTWRTHSAPELGEDAQSILNAQLGGHCDAIVAIFGARMGTPTPRAISGTAEEIDRFVADGKRVMVYFSSGPISREGFSAKQFQAVEKFKRDMRKRGLLGEYESTDDLRQQLNRHLVQVGYQLQERLISEQTRPRLSPTRSALSLQIATNLRTLRQLWEEIHGPEGSYERAVANPELLPAVRLARRDSPQWRRSVFDQQLPTIVEALTDAEVQAVDTYFDRFSQFDTQRGALRAFIFESINGKLNFEPSGLEAWERLQEVVRAILQDGNPLDAIIDCADEEKAAV